MNTKTIFKSKAVWGGLVAVAGAGADMMARGGPSPENLMTLAGALIAIYGRIVATTELSVPLIAPKS